MSSIQQNDQGDQYFSQTLAPSSAASVLIRAVYHPTAEGQPSQPNFPATDQHPDASRYLVGDYYVDAIGGKPTAEEIDAVLNPPKDETPTVEGRLAAMETRNKALEEELAEKSGLDIAAVDAKAAEGK